jgi:alpha-glucosidase
MGLEVRTVAEGVYRVGRFRDGRPAVYDSPALADRPAAGEPADPADFADLVDVESATVAVGPRLVTRRAPGERFFGCGERTAGLEKTGSHQVFWNHDPIPGHTASFNNLYTSIPFVLSLRDGRAYGLLFDNPGRAEIDLAKADPARVEYTAATGDLVFYVFRGPAVRDVLERYTALTGRTPLPPRWALGNQQSRWGYRSADEVRAVARRFRERDIPCDVIHLDIDYMDGYRVFTWDPERFPDPAGLLADLRADGFRVVTIIDPGVKVDEEYPLYAEGRSRGFFCLSARGEEFHNVVWPGLCAFPDFTDPAVREWWGDWHRGHVEAGVAGIWCDMNEPALMVPEHSTMPEDAVHPGGGHARFHGEVHNAYGSLMAQATREGLSRLRPDERPFVISRAGYAGLQRHALQWTGDNSSWWEHLWMAMPQLQNLGLSGIAWAGVDVGGFFDDSNGELLARWTEFGIFQPFCRNHTHTETAAQEPWAFGEPWESLIRESLRFRMRLVPYLYTLFEECHRTGAPILRPLLFEFPDDPTTYTADDEFMLGAALLVAPITRPGIEHRHVYLPAGTWFHWWTGERFEGPIHVLAHAPLGQPAVYARAGTPIPLGDPVSHTDAASGLAWRVFPGSGSGSLYEDAGDGYGAWCRRAADIEDGVVSLSARQGSFTPARESVVVELVGVGTAVVEEAADPVVIERFEKTDD